MKVSLIKKVAYIYLLIPVLIFCIGWLQIIVTTLFFFLIIGSLVSLFSKESQSDFVIVKRWDGILSVLVLIFWVGLSGIGGYAFQNWDHHSRNAVFSDLINFSWPVSYHLDTDIAKQFNAPSEVILSYYFGFWLPAALVGKAAGWGIANLFLFIWSLAGVIIAVTLTACNTKLSLLQATLLVVFFSGMDIVGVWLMQNIPGYEYPGIWPPIQHLEWWAGFLQYSSFTTDLFWTYNQFIPTFLLMALFANSKFGSKLFIFGVCLFFAPLPALGLLPFVIGNAIIKLTSSYRYSDGNQLSYFLKRLFSIENLTGMLIAVVALIFYSTNLSAQSRLIRIPSPFLLYLIFLALEGMAIWLLLLPVYRTDWIWYVVGFCLLGAPFIKLGESWDFMLRTTLPAFYLLMVGIGSFMAKIKRSNLIFALLFFMLIIGSLTPIYEINRSVVRTAKYYGSPFPAHDVWGNYFDNPPSTIQTFVPEFDHLETLVADDWGTVSRPNSVGWNTKVGDLFSSRLAFLFRKTLVHVK